MDIEAGDLPPPLPKFARARNKFGQEHGPYRVRVGKRLVNLKTESYIAARERAKEAFYDGKTSWDESRFYERPSSAPANGTSGAAPAKPAADWAADLAGAAAAVKPDEYRRPNGTTYPLLGASRSNDSESAPTDAPKDDAAPGTPGEESTKIPPEMFASMMETAAAIFVEAQFRGQEWLIERFAKRKAGKVPENDFSRVAATEFWKSQLAEWVPTDVPLPKWASAMILVGSFGAMTQLQNSSPLAKDVPTVS